MQTRGKILLGAGSVVLLVAIVLTLVLLVRRKAVSQPVSSASPVTPATLPSVTSSPQNAPTPVPIKYTVPGDTSTINLAYELLSNDKSDAGLAFYSDLFRKAFEDDKKVSPPASPDGLSQSDRGLAAIQLRAACKTAYTGFMSGGSALNEADATVVGNAAAEAYGLVKYG